MNENTRLKVEAAAFRGLVQHLQKRTDAQNIDIMNTAGFCRNCLAKWYRAAAGHFGEEIAYKEAQEIIYGMPVGDWKSKHQKPASLEQQKRYEETKLLHAQISVVQ